MFTLGLSVCPKAMFRAFVRGGRVARSMYCRRENRRTLAEMRVADLRASIKLDQGSVVPRPIDRIAFVLWAIAAVTTFLAPVLAVLVVFLAVRH
jgi:hypothetical protein